ncbi:hypothetical protein E2C01_065979 [Portunus trituberculatus]|uniref:Uncharacterized protein n=1 Tax=Portunus trituberculatus TaxID=210409 RepID=A0A5B7HTB2_PORTR|nr:hypothetical protein [Portunus trituberculatus]
MVTYFLRGPLISWCTFRPLGGNTPSSALALRKDTDVSHLEKCEGVVLVTQPAFLPSLPFPSLHLPRFSFLPSHASSSLPSFGCFDGRLMDGWMDGWVSGWEGRGWGFINVLPLCVI